MQALRLHAPSELYSFQIDHIRESIDKDLEEFKRQVVYY